MNFGYAGLTWWSPRKILSCIRRHKWKFQNKMLRTTTFGACIAMPIFSPSFSHLRGWSMMTQLGVVTWQSWSKLQAIVNWILCVFHLPGQSVKRNWRKKNWCPFVFLKFLKDFYVLCKNTNICWSFWKLWELISEVSWHDLPGGLVPFWLCRYGALCRQ